MPLLIDFKTGDKIIINGAAIENAGPHAKLLVHNRAAILRGKEVMSEAEARTPASRIYFSLQCAYMFPTRKEHYLELFKQFLCDYLAACPSAAPIVQKIENDLAKGETYRALKTAQLLLDHEQNILDSFAADMAASVAEVEAAVARLAAEEAEGDADAVNGPPPSGL